MQKLLGLIMTTIAETCEIDIEIFVDYYEITMLLWYKRLILKSFYFLGETI